MREFQNPTHSTCACLNFHTRGCERKSTLRERLLFRSVPRTLEDFIVGHE
jgi:hypothetical protein